MVNQTIAAVPPNIEDPKILKHFLIRLVEQLDTVLGYRGGDGYVAQSDLTTAREGLNLSLSSLNTALGETDQAVQGLLKSLKKLTSRVEDNEESLESLDNITIHEVLGSTYRDFNHVDWSTFTGNGEFSDVGSNITNAPYATVPGDTYYNFVASVNTSNGGVVQRLVVQHLGTIAVYQRAGDTWTDVTTIGWLAL